MQLSSSADLNDQVEYRPLSTMLLRDHGLSWSLNLSSDLLNTDIKHRIFLPKDNQTLTLVLGGEGPNNIELFSYAMLRYSGSTHIPQSF